MKRAKPVNPLKNLFDDDDFREVQKVIRLGGSDKLIVERIEKEVVIPQIDHIDFVTGRENLPRYFAYLLFHVCGG